MTRKLQRFLVTIWTEERTPGDIAAAIVEADLVDAEVETVHVLAYKDSDFVIQPGSSRMILVPAVNAAAPVWQGFRFGGGDSGNIILDSGGLQQS